MQKKIKKVVKSKIWHVFCNDVDTLIRRGTFLRLSTESKSNI